MVETRASSAAADAQQQTIDSMPAPPGGELTLAVLDEFNRDGENDKNDAAIESWGGMSGLEKALGTSLKGGIKDSEVPDRQARFGKNEFPAPESQTWFSMFLESFEDTTIIVLIVSAVVSLAIGISEDYAKGTNKGWIEGAAILFAVVTVAVVTATNNYRKEQQFRKLNDVKDDVDVVVVRGGEVRRISCKDLVVGDLLKLEAGDKVPADALLASGSDVSTNESALTGEPEDVKKSTLPTSQGGDRFLISGSTMSSGTARALVIATGASSRWGKSKSKLQRDSPNTPLQDKLETLANQIGYFGMGMAGLTFAAMIYMWWAHPESREPGETLTDALVEAFIMAVTIVVVAVPEGLPLAVTLSLAYSTQKMMDDNNLIRVLAACETMGNATNICSDKTGTLTENRMTVVECWLAGSFHSSVPDAKSIPPALGGFLIKGLSCNSTANLLVTDGGTKTEVSGSKTEGALLMMIRAVFGADYAATRSEGFDTARGDQLYTFSSKRKRMSVLLMSAGEAAVTASAVPMEVNTLEEPSSEPDSPGGSQEDAPKAKARRSLLSWGSSKKMVTATPTKPPAAAAAAAAAGEAPTLVLPETTENNGASSSSINSAMLYTKGASEAILAACSHYMDNQGKVAVLSEAVRKELEGCIGAMARRSLRTICAAHKPLDRTKLTGKESAEELETGLILDGLFGIKDPLRPDVIAAVAACQAAGIFVRMVTGDNIETAKAIATECGILTEGGCAIEGPDFRKLTPAQLDAILPFLQVMARSSPDDKHLLVTRLNGNEKHLPQNRQEWEALHPGRSWEKERDLLLPGYAEEWTAARSGKGCAVGSEVVGVTGDGTNDGPALKAADVGLSMGLSGTDVAKEASDIVILDDNFSSIVKAVVWGRSVFDNIRKFLQFQLTVNIVALTITFCAALARRDPPLNAVMMLWVNLIMDTMGALALGTESPAPHLLDRRPLRRDASLISRPMIRNILIQSVFQIALLAYLLLLAPGDFACTAGSTHHYTILFNTFVFCQIFNEFNARSIDDSMDVLRGLHKNVTFLAIILFTVIAQVFIVQFGGQFVKTEPLELPDWVRCVLMASLSLPLGGFMRLIPSTESPSSFAVLPALLSKQSAAKDGEKSTHSSNPITLSLVVWGLIVAAIPALVYREFNVPWSRHFVAGVAALGHHAANQALPAGLRTVLIALHGALDGLVLLPQ